MLDDDARSADQPMIRTLAISGSSIARERIGRISTNNATSERKEPAQPVVHQRILVDDAQPVQVVKIDELPERRFA